MLSLMNLLKSLLEIVGLTSIGMIGGTIFGYGFGTLICWLISIGAEPDDPLDGLPIVLFTVTFLGMVAGTALGFIRSIYLNVSRRQNPSPEQPL